MYDAMDIFLAITVAGLIVFAAAMWIKQDADKYDWLAEPTVTEPLRAER